MIKFEMGLIKIVPMEIILFKVEGEGVNKEYCKMVGDVDFLSFVLKTGYREWVGG